VDAKDASAYERPSAALKDAGPDDRGAASGTMAIYHVEKFYSASGYEICDVFLSL